MAHVIDFDVGETGLEPFDQLGDLGEHGGAVGFPLRQCSVETQPKFGAAWRDASVAVENGSEVVDDGFDHIHPLFRPTRGG